jgi:AcrR family transcriptional regulator
MRDRDGAGTAAAPTSEPRQSLRDEQKLLTRQRLLEAARVVFGEHGYRKTTVENIAAQAGASRATVYLHFPTKLDVLIALTTELESDVAGYYVDLDRVLSRGSRRDLRAWVERALDWFQRHRDMWPAWEEATLTEPQFALRAGAERRGAPEAMVDYLAQWPAARQDEARLRVELLIVQMERFFTRWAIQQTANFERELVLDVLTEMWWNTLRPPAGREQAGAG